MARAGRPCYGGHRPPLQWDAENRLTSANGVTYTYDGDGRQVAKSGGTLYWYGQDGKVLEETDLAGNVQNDYIYFGGQRVGKRDSAGARYVYLADPLGSARVVTDTQGNVKNASEFYPFGGERVITSTLPNNYKFTGLERDAETGLDHTLYRQLSSNYGRWSSPDRWGGNIANPQSLNRYAYVMNNPATFDDPLGLGGAPPGAVQYYIGLANYQRKCNQTPQACNYMNYESMIITYDYGNLEGQLFWNVTPVGPTGVGPGGPSGGGRSDAAALLAAAKDRVRADLQKPDCAKHFKDVAGCQSELSKVGFKDWGQLKFTTVNGEIQSSKSNTVGDYNRLTGAITLNSEVNWIDPDNTAALLDGQPYTYPALGAEASFLGVPKVTAGQYMDINILHELAHYSGRFDPDKEGNTATLWKDCVNK